jgi:hypothetical protein
MTVCVHEKLNDFYDKQVCAKKKMCATKYQNAELKETYFVDEVETQLREKHFRSIQT